MPAIDIAAGFNDPVLEAQSVFRSVLNGFADPGTVHDVHLAERPPTPLMTATAAIGLALFDMSTPVWIDPVLNSEAAKSYVSFHSGAPSAADPGEAAFAILDGTAGFPEFDAFSQGTAEYPDRSATLIFQVEGLLTDGGARLTGPGIATENRLAVDGVADGFWRAVAENHNRFPLGVDIILVAKSRLVCLPRTTRVEI